ncbi:MULTISPECIES: ATP-binding protein [Stutzerimonas stutzeri subgroup]|uniref:histidine kinase n=1 Tax=Stutzerimonas stutzeri CCUG 29243 TaxID=1196835 RepID=I4CML3_STUST|nr:MULTISPECIES: ATP-binding protein [Stutzerimonas stutzeri subgroup]AFM31320.1 sensory box histidine kinase/response regulator [Stutzerimonas stutzeri CCUG 29243]MCQ2038839.1 ATP-binding protein [Stutzerimonas kunmingensis]
MTQTLNYQAIFEAVPNLHLILAPDQDFTILAASDAQLRATHTRREESVGRPVFDVFRKNPDDPTEFGTGVLRDSLERVLRSRAPDRMAITRYDIPRPAALGGGFELRYWRPLNVPVLDQRGEVLYIIHQVEDVTEEVQREHSDSLSHFEERFRAALLASGIGTFTWFLSDGSLSLDSSLEQIFHLPLGQQVTSVDGFVQQVHPDDRAHVRLAFDHYAKGDDFTAEFRLVNAGAECWLACKAKAFRDANGTLAYVAGACTDISARRYAEDALRVSENSLRQLNETLEARVATEVTERSRAEEALRQAQKMEAVGQLTGGIAHDFNNLLTGIIGSLDLMQRRHQRGEPLELERYIGAAVTSAQRAAALTQRLLAFSRQQALDLKPVDVNQLVASLEDLLHRTTGENITIETRLSAGLLPACMDVNQLESALINLVINARDAMPYGGRISLSTASFTMGDTPDPKKRGMSAGEYVLLSVADTGTGMAPNVMARAFEPFFTTKPIGQGTGLGLSMVYGYIKQAKGYIQIESEPDIGTRVHLYLPVHQGEATALAHEPERTPTGAGETILVVEDEPVVRALVVEVLNELGYETLEAGEASEALCITESEQRIDLLISDVGLPGMNGRQLADIARQQRPGLKVLFATGYAESFAANDFLGPDMAVITKPFAIDVFASKVGEMLGNG